MRPAVSFFCFSPSPLPFAVVKKFLRPLAGWLTAALGLTTLAACRSTAPPPADGHAPLPTVKRVDLRRYAGQWHEVARLPHFFQRSCLKSAATYTLQPDGTVEVVNACVEKGGRVREIKGTAEPVPGSRNARLRVKFQGLAALAPAPPEGNYWIIALDPGYQWAMVGTPDRQNLWMLARRPELPFETYTMLKARAKALGYDVSKLIPETRQPKELKEKAKAAAAPAGS